VGEDLVGVLPIHSTLWSNPGLTANVAKVINSLSSPQELSNAWLIRRVAMSVSLLPFTVHSMPTTCITSHLEVTGRKDPLFNPVSHSVSSVNAAAHDAELEKPSSYSRQTRGTGTEFMFFARRTGYRLE
jgi:hypothetical protein